MPRGRRSQPDDIKALKGNPGKRRLALKAGVDHGETKAPLAHVELPDFLTHERERAIFQRVVDDLLQRRVARQADLAAYARWAHYLHRWIECKDALDGVSLAYETASKHGTMLRKHPLFAAMVDLERLLMALEDRLGLNPAARQTIIRGLAALPPAFLGDLFEEDRRERAAAGDPAPSAKEAAPPADSPLGFLARAGAAKPSTAKH
ncbi:P27 family phage terminase small subunit [Blastochloris tepida]|uniref:Terminase n=1 Tax=Blastochloris tepida TaxID=2233851 RepID=A0A348G1D3_9HYPH|nr:P27 family phage terminase small subunit [Blastochloris tepida]BBF93366.1 hypothetical protein BLTE_20510 [Blastochloris tepida]